MADRSEVTTQNTKLIRAVAEALKREGFLSEITQSKGQIVVKLAYKSKQPVLMDIKLISKLGLRVYKSLDEIKDKKGASLFIISTPYGVLSSKEAIKKQAGGEIIAEIY